MEFEAKKDISLDEKGLIRIEKISLDAYNESDLLSATVNRYFEKIGHYPERVLTDKIHQNRTEPIRDSAKSMDSV